LSEKPGDVRNEVVLQYESPPPPRKAPAWVWCVVGAYLMILAAGVLFPLWLARDDSSVMLRLPWLLVPLVAAWLALLSIPVKVISRRPVTKRSLWVPLIGSGLLLGLLVAGACAAITEWLLGTVHHEAVVFVPMVIGLIGWVGWGVVFWFISASRGPESVGMRLHRWLIAGSVLELLVAVPTHVVVRRREECCAGFATGCGISFGLVVMLVAFGPSVALLYHRRAKQIAPKPRIVES
jgi:hypothetical protein